MILLSSHLKDAAGISKHLQYFQKLLLTLRYYFFSVCEMWNLWTNTLHNCLRSIADFSWSSYLIFLTASRWPPCFCFYQVRRFCSERSVMFSEKVGIMLNKILSFLFSSVLLIVCPSFAGRPLKLGFHMCEDDLWMQLSTRKLSVIFQKVTHPLGNGQTRKSVRTLLENIDVLASCTHTYAWI